MQLWRNALAATAVCSGISEMVRSAACLSVPHGLLQLALVQPTLLGQQTSSLNQMHMLPQFFKGEFSSCARARRPSCAITLNHATLDSGATYIKPCACPSNPPALPGALRL
eukprot:204193-Pelagomonas_calceolata.AAC.5